MRIELGNGIVAAVEDPDPDNLVRLLKGLANGQGELAAAPSLLELTPPSAVAGPPARVAFHLPGGVWERVQRHLERPLPIKERMQAGPGIRVYLDLDVHQAVDLDEALTRAIEATPRKKGATPLYVARGKLRQLLDKEFGIEP